jgi:hypothetical protein
MLIDEQFEKLINIKKDIVDIQTKLLGSHDEPVDANAVLE